MSRKFYCAAFVLVAFALFITFNPISVSRAQSPAPLPTLGLADTIGGLALPVGIAHADDGTDRRFVVEQGGRILIVKNGDAATSATNPLDRSDFFVRQHYLDFLNREPDKAGLCFWTENIESCGASAGCREAKRIDTSAAFFLAIEFQETGFLVYRMHKAAFGNFNAAPVPIKFTECLRDTQEIGQAVVVNVGDWEAKLAQNKQSFANKFVARASCISR